MAKPELEFFDSGTVEWSPAPEQTGAHQRVLAADPAGRLLTRLVKWDPGFDGSSAGPVTHDYVEEVLILSGSLDDLSLGQTFGRGYYACRPPGTVHGPWTSREGCVMLEIRYEA